MCTGRGIACLPAGTFLENSCLGVLHQHSFSPRANTLIPVTESLQPSSGRPRGKCIHHSSLFSAQLASCLLLLRTPGKKPDVTPSLPRVVCPPFEMSGLSSVNEHACIFPATAPCCLCGGRCFGNVPSCFFHLLQVINLPPLSCLLTGLRGLHLQPQTHCVRLPSFSGLFVRLLIQITTSPSPKGPDSSGPFPRRLGPALTTGAEQ